MSIIFSANSAKTKRYQKDILHALYINNVQIKNDLPKVDL